MTLRQMADAVRAKRLLDLLLEAGLPADFAEQAWESSDEDRSLAWKLYTELRTRITTQPLHYLHGDEAKALQSVTDFFHLARTEIGDAGVTACKTATLTAYTLNQIIRPVTGHWNKRLVRGDLKGEDARHELRADLAELQPKLRQFGSLLAKIAEQEAFILGTESWPRSDKPSTFAIWKHEPQVPFTILLGEQVPEGVQCRMVAAERKAIIERRQALDLPIQTEGEATTNLFNVSGLAISGGGIRSAAFALGVVQLLVKHDVMKHFDYLSTVSGGGYLGSFLSTYLNSPRSAPVPTGRSEDGAEYDLKTDSQRQESANFENGIGLGRDESPLAKPKITNKSTESLPSSYEVGESAALRHLRAHSSYLLAGGVHNWPMMVATLMYGLVANAMIVVTIVAAALWGTAAFQENHLKQCSSGETDSLSEYIVANNTMLAMGIFLLGSLILLAAFDRICRFRKQPQLFAQSQSWIGLGIIMGACVACWQLLPWLLWAFHHLINAGSSADITSIYGYATAILSALLFGMRFLGSLSSGEIQNRLARRLGTVVMAIVAPAFILTLFLLIGEWSVVQPIIRSEPPKTYVLLGVAVGLGLYTFFFLDINQSSLHPFYRRKLCDAFCIRRTTIGQLDAVEVQPQLLLSELRQNNRTGPYHLINCALNGPASKSGAFRNQRGTDFFLFSSRFSGSSSTGYFRTKRWEAQDPHLDLATAMAISGAAASPVTGVVNLPVRQSLLALLNIRLDYWLPNLRLRGSRWRRLMRLPNPWYLLRQGVRLMDEKTMFINLSDGGHIENLGLYELLRRRCRYIVVIDGECDPTVSCGSLIQASRFAELDFGIKVELDLTRFRVGDNGACDFHFAYGEIDYGTQEDKKHLKGEILYIKLSRTDNEPSGVRHYRLSNPDFPHQSTGDQFFDEAQFEAYRSLGQHVAEDVLSEKVHGSQEFTDLEKVFHGLRTAMNDPTRN
jgi:MFS family permease